MLVCVHVYRPYAHNLCIYVHMEHYQIVDKTNFFYRNYPYSGSSHLLAFVWPNGDTINSSDWLMLLMHVYPEANGSTYFV